MTCEICNEKHDSLDHFSETHNPLDIPFGHEVQEVNNGIKDEGFGNSNDMEEGGLGSGRNPEQPGDTGAGSPGPLISFGNSSSPFTPQMPQMIQPPMAPPMGIHETIMKQLMDEKLGCRCKKNL